MRERHILQDRDLDLAEGILVRRVLQAAEGDRDFADVADLAGVVSGPDGQQMGAGEVSILADQRADIEGEAEAAREETAA